jgi:hypothetical protein
MENSKNLLNSLNEESAIINKALKKQQLIDRKLDSSRIKVVSKKSRKEFSL